MWKLGQEGLTHIFGDSQRRKTKWWNRINIFKTIIQENFLEIEDLNVILKKPTVYLEKLTQNGQF